MYLYVKLKKNCFYDYNSFKYLIHLKIYLSATGFNALARGVKFFFNITIHLEKFHFIIHFNYSYEDQNFFSFRLRAFTKLFEINAISVLHTAI